MVDGSCTVCNKKVTRTSKAVSCCVCSKFTHVDCGKIDNALLNQVINGSVEFKCHPCRRKSTRRSTINFGNETDGSNTTKAKSTLKAKDKGTGANNDSSVISMEEFGKRLAMLNDGFNVATDAIL